MPVHDFAHRAGVVGEAEPAGAVLGSDHHGGALPVGVPFVPPILVVAPHRTGEPVRRLARDTRSRLWPWCQIDGRRTDIADLQGCLRWELARVYLRSASAGRPSG